MRRRYRILFAILAILAAPAAARGSDDTLAPTGEERQQLERGLREMSERLKTLHGTAGSGRDHNPKGFLVWMAGAGVKGGVSHGATDEIGYRAASDPVTVHDLHATMLQLLGLDHKRLTYLHNGRRYRLTDVAGNVITKILA
jgi:hypothetical protein